MFWYIISTCVKLLKLIFAWDIFFDLCICVLWRLNVQYIQLILRHTNFTQKVTTNQQSIMVEQEQNSILLKMPLLVIEKILSNINNRLIVSLACKCLYGIVCGMERQRRIMYIKGTPRSTVSINRELSVKLEY